MPKSTLEGNLDVGAMARSHLYHSSEHQPKYYLNLNSSNNPFKSNKWKIHFRININQGMNFIEVPTH